MSRTHLLGIIGIFLWVEARGFCQALNDTIWEAEVEISNLNLQSVKEGVPQKGPILKNGTTILPMEIWFWNGSRCGLVFPTEKWNFRDSYEWVWGTPGEPDYGYSRYLGPKYWGGGGLAPSYENEEGKVLVTDSYTYHAIKKSGTLIQKTLYLLETSTRTEGSYWQVYGAFKISGNRLTVRSATYTLQPNPSGLNAYRVLSSPRLKSGTTFVKTSRRPSQEILVQAAFKYFSENSWDFPRATPLMLDNKLPRWVFRGLRFGQRIFLLCLWLWCGSAHAQLADTIWEGTQWIGSINMVSLKPNGTENFPSLFGARFNLPLEIWFLDSSHFGVVFRNDRWGFEGRRKGEYSGHPEENKSFTYRLKGGSGTFFAKEFNDYFGMQSYSGRLRLSGNKLTTDRVSYSAPSSGWLYENTELANIPCKRVGKLPVFENTVWTKTSRKPSVAKNEPGYITDP